METSASPAVFAASPAPAPPAPDGASTPAAVTAPSPATVTAAGPSGSSNGDGAEPRKVSLPTTGLEDEKKMEMIRGMDPVKLANIRKVGQPHCSRADLERINDLQNQGVTKESSSELFKLTLIIELFNKAKAAQ